MQIVVNEEASKEDLNVHIKNPFGLPIPNDTYDLFSKTIDYEYQMEYRIIIYSDFASLDPITIDMEALANYAIVIDNNSKLPNNINMLVGMNIVQTFDDSFAHHNCLLSQIVIKARKRDNGDIHIYSIIG